MKTHSTVQKLLYEYLNGEITEVDRNAVRNHLASCEKCSVELERLKDELKALDQLQANPSDHLSSEYWDSFILDLERRIQSDRSRVRASVSLWETVETFWMYHRSLAISLSSAAILLFLSIGVMKTVLDHWAERTPGTVAQQQAPVDTVRSELNQYFRKSKILLVGLTNMKVPEGQPPDFSVERDASRKLLHQARYLKNQPLDMRSAELIDDLQRIQLALANMKDEGSLSNVEIVNAGIRQENLLFKIRMAEAQYDTSRFVPVGNNF